MKIPMSRPGLDLIERILLVVQILSTDVDNLGTGLDHIDFTVQLYYIGLPK